jgi:hypothetical protein
MKFIYSINEWENYFFFRNIVTSLGKTKFKLHLSTLLKTKDKELGKKIVIGFGFSHGL